MANGDTLKDITAWEEATLAFLRARGWDPEGATLLLAVSGGADSVALLHFFARRAPSLGARISVIHVDHRLRAASSLDRDFVAALCDRLRVPCEIATLDPASRRPRESTEMWARRERYQRFAGAAARAGARFILTAHHRDDLVETVFQRLGRGTGPRGLAGIPFRRAAREGAPPGTPDIVRPFLSRSRAEITAYLGLLGETWREDESNADLRFDRNWYRLSYLPRLRAEDAGLDARVFAFALSLQDLRAGIDRLEAAADLLRRDARGRAWLPAEAVAGLLADEESLAFWLKRLVRESGARAPVTREILREFARQWKARPEGDDDLQVPLSRFLAIRRRNRRICCEPLAVEPRKAKKGCPWPEQRVILEAGSGSHAWRWGDRNFRLTARTYPRPRSLAYPGSEEKRAIFDADLISCTLLVRTRREGDRFSPHGVRSKSRKLKVFFNEEKIPPAVRDEIPLILSDATPAWVPGHGISEFFKVSGATTRILELELEQQ